MYAQDRTYSSSWNDCKREENEEKDRVVHFPSVEVQNTVYSVDRHATLQELMLHLKSYYKVRFSLGG